MAKLDKVVKCHVMWLPKNNDQTMNKLIWILHLFDQKNSTVILWNIILKQNLLEIETFVTF